MPSKKYEFEIVSQANSIIGWLIFVIAIMAMAVMGISFEGTAATIGVLLVAALFVSKTSSAKTQWVLDENGVWVSYLIQGAFVRKPDQGWSWDEIADVELFEEKTYEGFKFTFLKGGTRKYYVNMKSLEYKAFIEAIQMQFGDIQWRRPPAGIITDIHNAHNE